ncbi:hypothetical protein EZV62_020533 [Acer yangbiense]|uniref:Uncharacterized protein n=1 Tax=Acer yangbiense TaxID=1000413 RepID=A0A5C7HEA4_9ROSI|nr:hypothetical protein EZV62_020533 [Acer yangbiense]
MSMLEEAPTRLEGKYAAMAVCWLVGNGSLSMEYYADLNATFGKRGTETFIGICAISAAFGLSDAHVQGGMVGDLSFMTPELVQCFLAGATAGALTSALRLITKPLLKIQQMVYARGLYNCAKAASEGSKTVSSNLSAAGIQTLPEDTDKQFERLSNKELILQNVDYAIDMFLIYVLTLSIFPGFLSEDTGSHSFGTWYALVLIAMYNVWDLIGIYISLVKFLKLESRKGLMVAVLSRFLLIPAFYFMAKYGDQRWMIMLTSVLGLTNGYITVCVLTSAPKGYKVAVLSRFLLILVFYFTAKYGDQRWMIMLTFVLGLTNGYLTVCVLTSTPKGYKGPEQNALGNLLVLFLSGGIFAEVILDWLWLIGKGWFHNIMVVMVAVLSRFLFIPSFYFTAKYGDHGWMIMLTSVLVLTNGYLTIYVLTSTPKGYKGPEQNALGNLLVLFLSEGIFAEVILDWLWLIGKGWFHNIMVVMVAVLSRFLLIPVFYFTAKYGDQRWMIMLTFVLGLTNGYLTVCVLTSTLKGYKGSEQNALENLLVLFLSGGIFVRVILDWLWLIGKGW